MRRIFRWTIGDCSEIGISILEHSIRSAKKLLTDFEFYVCLNSDSCKVEKICLKNKVELVKPNWNSFPLPENIIPKEYDLNSKSGIPRGRQGSFWKLCPPRLDINSYEIVCDNDLILKKIPSEINDFLKSDVPFISEEVVYSLGKYTKYLSKPYNSGLYGLPPNYDFGKELFLKWEETGSMNPLLSRDEQGLIALTITSKNFINIPEYKTCFLFHEGEPEKACYDQIKENGFDCLTVKTISYSKSKMNKDVLHFLGANRKKFHFYWNQYELNRLRFL